MNCEFLTSNRDLRIFIDIENKKNQGGNFSSYAVVKQFIAEFSASNRDMRFSMNIEYIV